MLIQDAEKPVNNSVLEGSEGKPAKKFSEMMKHQKDRPDFQHRPKDRRLIEMVNPQKPSWKH